MPTSRLLLGLLPALFPSLTSLLLLNLLFLFFFCFLTSFIFSLSHSDLYLACCCVSLSLPFLFSLCLLIIFSREWFSFLTHFLSVSSHRPLLGSTEFTLKHFLWLVIAPLNTDWQLMMLYKLPPGLLLRQSVLAINNRGEGYSGFSRSLHAVVRGLVSWFRSQCNGQTLGRCKETSST